MLIFRYGDEWALCSRHSNGIKTLCCNERMDLKGMNGDKVDTCGPDAKYWDARKWNANPVSSGITTGSKWGLVVVFLLSIKWFLFLTPLTRKEMRRRKENFCKCVLV